MNSANIETRTYLNIKCIFNDLLYNFGTYLRYGLYGKLPFILFRPVKLFKVTNLIFTLKVCNKSRYNNTINDCNLQRMPIERWKRLKQRSWGTKSGSSPFQMVKILYLFSSLKAIEVFCSHSRILKISWRSLKWFFQHSYVKNGSVPLNRLHDY